MPWLSRWVIWKACTMSSTTGAISLSLYHHGRWTHINILINYGEFGVKQQYIEEINKVASYTQPCWTKNNPSPRPSAMIGPRWPIMCETFVCRSRKVVWWGRAQHVFGRSANAVLDVNAAIAILKPKQLIILFFQFNGCWLNFFKYIFLFLCWYGSDRSE